MTGRKHADHTPRTTGKLVGIHRKHTYFSAGLMQNGHTYQEYTSFSLDWQMYMPRIIVNSAEGSADTGAPCLRDLTAVQSVVYCPDEEGN